MKKGARLACTYARDGFSMIAERDDQLARYGPPCARKGVPELPWDRHCVGAGVALFADQLCTLERCARLVRACPHKRRAVLADSHIICRAMAAALVERVCLGVLYGI